MKPMQDMMDGLLVRLDIGEEMRRVGRSVVLRRIQRRLAALGVALVACLSPSMGAAQQDLGHKIPGVAGLDAGRQPEPGIVVSDRVVYYDVIRLRGRNGEPVVVPGLDMWAVTNAVGVSWTARLASGLLVTAAASVPIARLHVSVDHPLATVDTFGLGDVYVKPVQIGWRWRRADVLASYGFYSPTRQTAREGLGSTQWAHQSTHRAGCEEPTGLTAFRSCGKGFGCNTGSCTAGTETTRWCRAGCTSTICCLCASTRLRTAA